MSKLYILIKILFVAAIFMSLVNMGAAIMSINSTDWLTVPPGIPDETVQKVILNSIITDPSVLETRKAKSDKWMAEHTVNVTITTIAYYNITTEQLIVHKIYSGDDLEERFGTYSVGSKNTMPIPAYMLSYSLPHLLLKGGMVHIRIQNSSEVMTT